ncbi:FliM/FliN family flagellar motor switch protein [Granulicella sp. dw_53]|uniref:flagellar motor switch protein FliM n=1 Tax=Granulicella sp. dw_53 TaxID=2719792 RepID=UPI001BD58150|nr:FliM/FliN family flagellar motor switch protein [Granulicella sp. dw_53]
MKKQLEQDSIDALFAAAKAGMLGEVGEVQEVEEETSPELYNFSRAGQISNEQMRAISTVNNLFARNLMRKLAAWLRTEFDVRLVAGEQLPFVDFVERLSKPMYVCSMGLAPFDALGLMEIDIALALPMVDILLGGTGHPTEPRELTDIEEAILLSVVQKILQELNLAWQPVGLQMELERRETEDQIERMMTPMERTLCVSFEVRVPKALGMLNLCFPASVLNAILRRMVAEGGRQRRRSSEAKSRMRELMEDAKVGAVLQFPPMRMRARELATLVPGSILRLPLGKNSDAELRIGGLAFGGAHPVRTGEHRGAQLVELPGTNSEQVEVTVQ